MKKLIRLSDKHYVVVDDSEINIGEWCYGKDINDNMKVTIHQAGSNDLFYQNPQITHSFGKQLEGVINKPLSEVEEIINGYSLEDMSLIDACSIQSETTLSSDFEFQAYIKGYQQGFKAHQELVKDKLFTIDDMRKSIDMARETSEEIYMHPEYGFKNDYTENEIIESFLPKTEWDIEIDEQNKITVI